MDKTGWHAALYHRLHWLWPLIWGRAARPIWRGVCWLGLALLVAFAGLLSYMRFQVMPHVADYQGLIETKVSEALGLQVRIGQMSAYWSGINPGLELKQLTITDKRGHAALTLNQVQTQLSWRSLWHREPTLDLLAVEAPNLTIRRDAEGHITVAGLATAGESDPRMVDWILRQTHIRIRNARVDWLDEQRQAPPLHLEQLQFGLDNRGDTHRFGLSAQPPSALASPISLRGDMDGESLNRLNEWSGEFYAEMDYVDLAAWSPWADYPFALPRGRGGLRLWLDLARNQWKVVADTALDDVRLRLGKALPELNLQNLRGRFEAEHQNEHWRIAGKKVELSTRDGLKVPATTFDLDWKAQDGEKIHGKANANRVDLNALGRLAAHLPLDEKSRQLLQDYSPQGVLSDFRGVWESTGQGLERYALKGRFAGLGINPVGNFPGAAGISGEVDATETGGSLSLDAKNAAIDAPAIFAEPRINFTTLQAKSKWKLDKGVLNVTLDSLKFKNSDVAGSVQGVYNYNGQGPGTIDLTGTITQGEATGVWRYLPLVVHAEARDWVKRGLVAGKATEAKLELRGDLANFPFREKSQGKFLVTVKAKDVKLDYAPNWPPLEAIEGDVRFEGPGMVIEARKGRLLGASIGPARVQVPDFDVPERMLLVKGEGKGPTQEFLNFIEKSPVSEKIDRFTEEMRATGDGHLDLEIAMPLNHVLDTRIKGDFQFLPGSKVTVMPGMPPVSDVAGRLSFTESAIHTREVKGSFLGSPMKLSANSDGEKVNVSLSGGFNVAEARKQMDMPLLDALSGSTPWKGEVKVKKKGSELVIESSLVGISSSLPDMFNKPANASWPLRLVKGSLSDPKNPVAREQITLTLGKLVDARLIRRRVGGEMVLERGAVGIGEAAKIPARGLAVSASMPRLDVDVWQRWLNSDKGNKGAIAGAASGGGFSLPAGSTVSLRTPVVLSQGRRFDDASLQLRPEGSGWQIGINSRQAVGEVHWNAAGKGALRADLRRLQLNTEGEAPEADQGQLINDLPGLDIRVVDFSINERRFGRLEVNARNEAGAWRIDRLNIDNPDGHMSAKGMWKNQGGFNRTQLEFDLDADNVGGLLDRLGYPGAIKRGNAKLRGQVSWQGSPSRLDYGSLSGELKVEASKGQFAKVEPGIGKLLGLISLQSLPRRITLDFRDVFSDGFAFDNIESRLVIVDGVMRTAEDLRIDGPAARILMRGTTDLKKETQVMTVNVQPEIGGAAALGVAIANPVVGVATLLASKVLQNPLNRLFSFQYKVTGTWDDPKVEKLTAANNPANAAPAPAADSKGESK